MRALVLIIAFVLPQPGVATPISTPPGAAPAAFADAMAGRADELRQFNPCNPKIRKCN